MSLLLALLLSPALAADLPQDPVDKRMVVGETERRSAQELERAQVALARYNVLRQRFEQDGDLARYAKEREPLVQELRAAKERLLSLREDIKREQMSQQAINLLALISKTRGNASAETTSGPRVVEIGRIMGLERQLGELEFTLLSAYSHEEKRFKEELERDRQRKLQMLFAAAAFLALAAGGTFLFFRLRRKA